MVSHKFHFVFCVLEETCFWGGSYYYDHLNSDTVHL